MTLEERLGYLKMNADYFHGLAEKHIDEDDAHAECVSMYMEFMNMYIALKDSARKLDRCYLLGDATDHEVYDVIQTDYEWTELQRMVCDFVDDYDDDDDFVSDDGYDGDDCIYSYVLWRLKKLGEDHVQIKPLSSLDKKDPLTIYF